MSVRSALRIVVASSVGALILAGTETVVAYPHPSSPAELFFSTAFWTYLAALIVAAVILEGLVPERGLDLWLPLALGVARVGTNSGDANALGLVVAALALALGIVLFRRIGDSDKRPPFLFGVTVGVVLPILAGRMVPLWVGDRLGHDVASIGGSAGGVLLFVLLRAFIARWPRVAPVFLLGPVISLMVWQRNGRVDGPATVPPASARDARPDVVLVVLDTVRYASLESGGSRFNTMPNVEAFGRSATTFTRAWTTGSWTLPAHASLFSGKSVGEHHYDSGYSPQSRLSPQSFLAPRLARSGYATSAAVANFGVFGREEPLLAGFDRVVAEPLRPFAYRPWLFAALTAFSQAPWPASLVSRFPGPSRRARDVVDDALRLWSEGRGRPRFLFVNLMEAHLPWIPDARDVGRLGPRGLETEAQQVAALRSYLDGGRPSAPETEQLRARYQEALLTLDREVGRLLSGLRPGTGRDLVVAITSDHGESLGEHDRFGHRNSLDDVAVRVPLFVRSPRLPPGRVEAPVTLTAVNQMIESETGLGVAGAWSPVNDGILIEHRPGPQGRLPASYPRGDLSALIRWPYKYVEGGGAPGRLFDLSADPREDRDLAARLPGMAASLMKELHVRSKSTSETTPSPDGSRERLRALGYIR